YSQPEGPIRIVMVRDVEEVIYEDGQYDTFEKQPDAPAPKTTSYRPEPVKKNPILEGGFFIEGLIGYGQYERRTEYYYYDDFGYYYPIQTTTQYSELAFTIRLGNKWYFGQNEKWRPGLQATWLRLTNFIDTRDAETF